ncbi:MAG TPA: hypothetical protein DEG90_04250 [Porphyromonadaceae bacterium]|nr:hypothetical protein [Porphyromonadaceae bacterium]
MCKCLYCYKPLADGEVDYHKSCARKIFESTTVPVLPYTRANIKELALTLNGKKKKIKRADFEKAMLDSGMDEKAIEKLFKKFAKTLPKWYALIEESFLPKDMIVAYREKLNTMSARLGLL